MTRRALARGALFAWASACSALVPEEVPSFSCMVGADRACAAGEYCSATGACRLCESNELACDGVDDDCDGIVDNLAPCPQGTCIAGRCVTPEDGGGLPDTGPPPDVYTCSAANCLPPSACDTRANTCVRGGSVAEGSACVADSVCTTGSCATAGMVPASWLDSGRFCTKACCTSSDCAAGSVCANAGTGGRYCVKGSVLGIASVGTKAIGESCQAAESCRSGRCESGTCADTCCTDASCGSGRRCTVSSVWTGSASSAGLHCRPTSGSSNTAANRRCVDPAACTSGICRQVSTNLLEPSLCMAPCCSSSSCGSATGFLSLYTLRCSYERPEGASSVVASCREGANASGNRIGEACTVDGDCFSNQCDSMIGKCTDVCCGDDDCDREASGWRCLPSSTKSPYAPRCQPPR